MGSHTVGAEIMPLRGSLVFGKRSIRVSLSDMAIGDVQRSTCPFPGCTDQATLTKADSGLVLECTGRTHDEGSLWILPSYAASEGSLDGVLEKRILRNTKGEPIGVEILPTLNNVRKILLYSEMTSDSLWIDGWTHTLYWNPISLMGSWYRSEGIKPLEDDDITTLRLWLESHWKLRISKASMQDMVARVARDNRRWPVVEALGDLQWDGKSRLNKWLRTYAHVEGPSIVDELGYRWMVGAVARAYAKSKPVKMDNILVFVGPEGTGKTTTFGLLGSLFKDSHFSSTPIPMGDPRKYAPQIASVWLWEIGEMHSTSRAMTSEVKNFLSQTSDTYVPVYGRTAITTYRHVVFCGSTNRRQFIKDSEEGHRRFWPVLVPKKIDLQGIERDRVQFWAEAVALYLKGEVWHLSKESESELRAWSTTFCIDSPWKDTIEDWLYLKCQNSADSKVFFTMKEVLGECLQLTISQQGQAAQQSVGNYLHALGAKPLRVTAGEGRRVRGWVWTRPKAS